MLNLESYRGLWSLGNGPCRKWVFNFSGQDLEVRPTLQNIKGSGLVNILREILYQRLHRFPRIFAKLPIKKKSHCQLQRPNLKGLFHFLLPGQGLQKEPDSKYQKTFNLYTNGCGTSLTTLCPLQKTTRSLS